MTDRYNALTVVLDREIREDDAEPLIQAIQMLKGVMMVTPHIPTNLGEFATEVRVRAEISKKINEALSMKL